MELKLIEIDSKALNNVVARIDNFDIKLDFKDFEKAYLEKFKPFYVYIKLPINDLRNIHEIEKNGFNFMEVQFEMEKMIKSVKNIYQDEYVFVEIKTENEVNKIIDMASSIFTDDRISIDPELPKNWSGRRYSAYIKHSFEAENERIFKLVSKKNNEICGFKTFRIETDKRILLLLGGVANKYKNTPLGLINAITEINYLVEQGYKKIITHISARNTPIVNLELSWLNYKVVDTNVILRKVYKENIK